MRTVFADTYYFIAHLNPSDRGHAKAKAFTASFKGKIATTEWVLVEVGDAMCRPPNREKFCDFYRDLATFEDFDILPTTLTDGFLLFEDRLDKEWSLTDCISFAVMREHGITDALTGDRHFEQAGFVALLK